MAIMMEICPKCGSNGFGFAGGKCDKCGTPVINTGTTWDKYCYEFNNVQKQEWLKEVTEKYVKSSPEFSEQAMSKRFDIEAKERQIDKNQVVCSKCGSTQIHTEKRGWKLTAGFLGSSQIMITCLNCGYRWKAGK